MFLGNQEGLEVLSFLVFALFLVLFFLSHQLEKELQCLVQQ